MATAYRVIKYEFDTQERLDHQLDRSLAAGTHNTSWGAQEGITVVDVPVDSGLGATIHKLTTNIKPVYNGCITVAQAKANS